MDGHSGMERMIDYQTLNQALRKAAYDHESGGIRVPMAIQTPEGIVMSQQEVLESCQRAGFFR